MKLSYETVTEKLERLNYRLMDHLLTGKIRVKVKEYRIQSEVR